jgi:hypothetical protein
MNATVLAAAIAVGLLPAIWVQAADEPFIGPLTRAAIQRAAVDATAASPSESRSGGRSNMSNWSRVTGLRPGGEIILTSAGVQRAKRYLLRTDESGLTVLNVYGLELPDDVRKTLISTAAEHPDYFFEVHDGATFQLKGPIRLRRAGVLIHLSPAGVVVGGRSVADLEHVVQHVAKEDLVEVSVNRKHLGDHMRRGLVIGAIAGALGGIGLARCEPGAECWSASQRAVLGAVAGVYVGFPVGTVIGLIAPRSPDVIYRAP